MALKMNHLKSNLKRYFISNFIFVFASVLLCGCGRQDAARENEIVMQLCETDGTVNAAEQQETDSREFNESKNLDSLEPSESDPADADKEIYVYVCGAVNHPGVYPAAGGSRLFELVEMAGGLTAEADETCLNLARAAVDGEQIVVLTKEETAALAEQGLYIADQPAGTEVDLHEDGLVNINTASVAELTTLSGIGETRAQAIVAYREAKGGFQTIEDIKNVDGIKEGLFSKIKDKIKV